MMGQNQPPLLSIIVPVYNASRTLSRCLSYLLNQTYKNIEIICVNDCSTDSSEEIMEHWRQKYPQQIKCITTEKRLGPGGARNHGMTHVSGMYTAFVDSDDWIDSCLCSVVIQHLLKSGADIAIYGVKDEYESPLNSKLRYDYRYCNVIDNHFALNILSRNNGNDSYVSSMVCQKIFKRSFLQDNNLSFHATSYYEDDLFTFQCFTISCKIVMVPNVYYHYYQRPDSITHTFSKKHISDLTAMIEELKQNISDRGKWNDYADIYYAFCDKCIRSTISALFSAEPTVQVQKRYLVFLFTQLQTVLPLSEWIGYADIETIKRILSVY